ncbi:cytochrome c3 family protein [Erythrobacter sp.]|uniref:cytochrome c3 family protein n=1 Tax=Erythrobacter sp. TaxID=1042 RepID=UPI003C7354D9
MAFLIRTIDTTAAGREIVRDRTIDSAAITVGRASDNDIHLPDLAVEQRHVRLDQQPGGTVRAETIGGLGFGIDGRVVEQAEIDPAVGAEISLGSARLAISRGNEGASAGPVRIVIKQVDRVEGAADELQNFALASTLPSKRAVAWSLAALILVLLLSVPIVTHLTRDLVPNDPDVDREGQVLFDAAWSSGELSMAHHDLQDNCEACHATPFVSVQDETCLTCHEELGEHAATPRLAAGMPPLSTGDAIQWNIAQTLGKEGPLSCVSCHSEHEGPVELEAASEQFCSDCHGDLDTRLTRTSLGNAGDFGKKHPQFRPQFYSAHYAEEPVRMSLDANPVEKSGLIFPHDVHMDEQGGAARMALSLGRYGSPLECADCHEREPDGVNFEPVVMEDACESCHSLVLQRTASGFRKLRHGDVDDLLEDLASVSRTRNSNRSGRMRPGQFRRGGAYYSNFGPPVRDYTAISRALSEDGVCGECHIPDRVNGRPDLVPVNLPDDYLVKGYFDHEAHEDEDCTDCHAANTSDTASDLLLPDLDSCRDCHLGATATKTRKIVPSSCATCHGYHTPTMPWRPEDHPPRPGGTRPDNVAAMFGRPRR